MVVERNKNEQIPQMISFANKTHCKNHNNSHIYSIMYNKLCLNDYRHSLNPTGAATLKCKITSNSS